MKTTASRAEATAAPLLVEYLPREEINALRSPERGQLLGVAGFGAVPTLIDADIPVSASFTPALAGEDELCEVFRVAGSCPVSATLRAGRVSYRVSDDLLFGCLRLHEREFIEPSAAQATRQALMRATETAYQEMFALLAKTAQPHLLRIWNYLPDINEVVDDEERYRVFNAARQAAFRNVGRAANASAPAACALGSMSGSPLSLYFLSTRTPPTMIENPRQTSAYHYPAKFGRHSPLFSRACISSGSHGTNLFISGTASIVGFDTVHAGDVTAQTQETLANIEALLEEANRLMGWARYQLSALKLKVYVRNPLDGAAIAAVLETAGCARPLMLKADVCREDLLVEIEATG
jgi:enamine deaminase RidA (YjgF/YER057c/UK114 family)